MGWKSINGRRYYYQSERDGSRVKSTYFGAGLAGHSVALLDAEAREERRTDRDAERDQRERESAEEREVDAWFGRVEAVAHAAMIVAGYHKHHRSEWRRLRDGGRDQAGGPSP